MKDNRELSPYAEMMGVLNGVQVLRKGEEIDKWEFYAYNKGTPIEAAKMLLKGKLIDFTFRNKDNG